MPEWGPADFAMPGEMMQWFYKARQFGDYKGFDPTRQTLLDNPKFWEAIDDLSQTDGGSLFHRRLHPRGALDGETGQWETKPESGIHEGP